MIYDITDLIEDDYEVVEFEKNNKKYAIKIRGITAYDIAEMWKEKSLREIIRHMFSDLDKTDSNSIYEDLLGRAPELIQVFVAICDYDKKATPEFVKRMPTSAQIKCFDTAINLTFNMKEQEQIETELKKLIADTLALMRIFAKEENESN